MLQRCATAAVLIYDAVANLRGGSQVGPVSPQVIAAAAGILLLLGLWTPMAGVVVAGCELWIMISGSGDPWMALVLATLGASLAMIGPGACSMDAHFFGRKQIKTRR
ncbi:hypothetical protein [Bryocella elongata]|nr:hypothetical protein [Bryocella elongata]